MKLTSKEKEVLSILRELDALQRDRLLARMRRAAIASRATAKAAQVKRVRTVPDHKIVKAYGLPPIWRRKER